jgi:DNA-entry nuclease
VKPIYVGADLVPVGSEIEAQGIGNNISFNVFVPNVGPGVSINYVTGVAKVK